MITVALWAHFTNGAVPGFIQSTLSIFPHACTAEWNLMSWIWCKPHFLVHKAGSAWPGWKQKHAPLCVFRTGRVTARKNLVGREGRTICSWMSRQGWCCGKNARLDTCVNSLALSHISADLKSKWSETPCLRSRGARRAPSPFKHCLSNTKECRLHLWLTWPQLVHTGRRNW